MEIKKHSVIIDTDPGIDDAVALVMALTNPSIDVKLVSCVVGNVNADLTTNNTLKLVEFLGSDVPVAKGATEPLLNTLEDASMFHGETGLAGFDFPEVTKELLPRHAVLEMRDALLSSDGQTTIFALGPLTNVALLLKMFPEVKEKIDRIIYMGGSFKRGNTSSAAEFNIYNDPHAAEIVMRAGVPLVMLGLDVTGEALLERPQIEEMRQAGKVGDMLYGLFSHYRGGSIETGLRIHDACVVAYFLKPGLFASEMKHVQVVQTGPAAGATVIDNVNEPQTKTANVAVCHRVNVAGFQQLMVEQIQQAARVVDNGGK